MTREELKRVYDFALAIAYHFNDGPNDVWDESSAFMFEEAKSIADSVEQRIGQLGRIPAYGWKYKGELP